jgi:hypothetical protein
LSLTRTNIHGRVNQYAQLVLNKMAYSQSLDQKRRETLRRQLYGKEVMKEKVGGRGAEHGEKKSGTHQTYSYSKSHEESPTSALHTPSYLIHDLTKILIFSAIAVAAQLALFFAVNSHLIKLPI